VPPHEFSSAMLSTRVSYDNGEKTLGSGIRISFHDDGTSSSNRSLVLLHGLNSHSGTWRNNIPAFASLGWRTIAPTLPRVNREPTGEDIKEYSMIIHELVFEKLGANEISIIGNSMGGWIAMQVAVLFHDEVEHLVLEDSAGVDSYLPEKISTPTLIIWGTRDEILPIRYATKLNSKINKSKLVTFETAGHVPHWEDPEGFNATVREFLRG
jgi:pimeloyl-ACP methyl ester carboxylesterase